MKTLASILDQIPHKLIKGDYQQELRGIAIDSRLVLPGYLFVAVKGYEVDGHQYISAAIDRGASAILCNDIPEAHLSEELSLIEVSDTRLVAGIVAANFYGWPSRYLSLVGVTGTNGKTSIVQLAHQLFSSLGFKSGLLSTIENKIGWETHPAQLTTPDSVSLQKMLAEMVAQNCKYAFMEVSSHAVEQHRINGCHFSIGVFTNITHDHLDYHGSFDAYIKAKKKFFDQLSKDSSALINLDDRHSEVMVQNSKAKVSSYALRKAATFKGKLQDNTAEGMQLLIDGIELYSQLVGAFNASNLLAVYAIARLTGQEKLDVLQQISALAPPPGRMEMIRDEKRKITAFIDYAHTPDAIKNVLETINDIKRSEQQVITVVGCGGNRDAQKRPVMTEIAIQYSNKVILTSDNPRNEDPEQIIEDMKKGIPKGKEPEVLSVVNRKEAIKMAIALSSEGSILLIAGKGHETYQEIKGVRYPFDDRSIVRECFNHLG